MVGILVATLTPLDGDGTGCPLGLPCLAWHFGLFAALGVPIAARFATSEAARRSPRRALAYGHSAGEFVLLHAWRKMVVLAFWLFAAGGEIAQGWVEGRDPQLFDWVADMAGALTGLLVGSTALRWLLSER